MILKKLKLCNFRGYKDEISINFDNLTVLVGKNDIGKSTILEALDIFFNEGSGVVKIDKGDKCKYSDDDIMISVTFSNLPNKLILDESYETSLEAEYLLNADKELEIIKIFRDGRKTKVYIKCNHPTHPKCSKLLEKKILDLKKIAKDENIQINDCDMRVSAHIRKAIREHFKNELKLDEVEIDLTKEDAKNIWDKLQQYLPQYYLFQSDRKNSDTDSEVQDPLKLIVREILAESEISEKLNEIFIAVRERLQQFSNKTLEELKKIDEGLANSLHPSLPICESLKWGDVFKNVNICGDDAVPINKRGSGVRRLILLSFFKAKIAQYSQKLPIIYAIEEPETSQHFDNQMLLTDTFLELSKQDNTQVILTTHSSTVIKALSLDNVIMITNQNGKKVVEKPQSTCTTMISLNEVAYLALGCITPEYHSELYEEILYLASKRYDFESNQKHLDSEFFVKQKGEKIDKPWWGKPNRATFHTYIRNQNHHSKDNGHAKIEDIKISIEKLREYLSELKNSDTTSLEEK